MEFGALVRRRLTELGLEQKELAAAAEVTESYVSQLLSRKKEPPAPERTDIYEKMEKFLKLPDGRLASLASHERRDDMKRALSQPPAPLHREVRELILRRCAPATRPRIRATFENEPFGPLEQMVTQKLLNAVKNAARKELQNASWLRLVAKRTGRTYKQMRVLVLEFLDTDALTLSVENGIAFLDPLIESWDIDLTSFTMEIVLHRRLAPGHSRRLEFVERELEDPLEEPQGFKEFLRDPTLSRDVAAAEIEFLRALRFKGRHPTPLYYYRALQGLRDPLHFRPH